MARPIVTLVLLAALAVPGLSQARETPADPGRYAAAWKRGAAKPAPPRTLAEEARCSAAWQMVWTVYWISTRDTLPPGFDRKSLEAQSQAWYDRLDEQGDAGRQAMKTADQTIIQPLAKAGEREKIMEIAGACGLTD